MKRDRRISEDIANQVVLSKPLTKIDWIREYRDRTGKSLKDCKDAIEAAMKRNSLE